MFSFLELPLEIRMMIYRSLRTTRSLQIKNPGDDRGAKASIGYASYGFYPRILATNHQISLEAKQVFYGENYWTLYAGHEFHINSVAFHIPPLSSALPYIRKVLIRFRMFNGLFLRTQGIQYSPPDMLSANFEEICKILLGAPSLQTVQMVWTEISEAWSPAGWGPTGRRNDWEWTLSSGTLVDVLSWLTWDVVQPLKTLKPTVKIQKGEIMAMFKCNVRSTAMETAFGNCVDTVVAHRAASSAAPATGRR